MIEVATTKAKEDPIKLVKKMLITLIKYRMKWEIHQAVLVMSAKTIVDTEEALIEVVVEETEVIITEEEEVTIKDLEKDLEEASSEAEENIATLEEAEEVNHSEEVEEAEAESFIFSLVRKKFESFYLIIF